MMRIFNSIFCNVFLNSALFVKLWLLFRCDLLIWFLFERDLVERWLDDEADDEDAGFVDVVVVVLFDINELLDPFVEEAGPEPELVLFINETEFKFGVGELDKTFFLIK